MDKQEQPSFRDRPINIDNNGKRKWIYAKQPKGKWYIRRNIFAWVCLLFLIFAPIIKIGNNPLMLLDIASRKFSLFGNLIYAQDNYILALIMAVTVVFIVMFTVTFGRLWCGWACPQTIFLEMIFRRIEYLFEGNYRHGKKPTEVSIKLVLKRLTKHVTFLMVSIFFTNIFLMWFTGPQKLLSMIKAPISENITVFSFMLAISIFYYWIYSYFREQVCTMICPYGRLQGVLLDSKSISVIYDYKRGEPRGSKTAGDCIDCGQCIAVCPTGIDIKNGSQLECINCTACIDECNVVMKKIKKQPNLIRFDSVYGIETGKRIIGSVRTYAYSAVLLVLVIVLSAAISKRTLIDATIIRVSGTIYQEMDNGEITNMFTTKVINKTNANKKLSFRLLDKINGTVKLANQNDSLKGNGALENILIVAFDKQNITHRITKVTIGIFEKDNLLMKAKINFIAPVK